MILGPLATSRFVLLYFVVFMMAPILYNSPHNAIASSLSFGMQEITNPPGDWVDMWRGNPAHGSDYTDLRSVNYFSNGKFFNATLWLSSFNPKPPADRTVNYGMYFDSDLNNKTGIAGIDYKVEISWNGKAKTWTRVFEFWSSNGGVKTVEKTISNYSGFYGKGDGYGYVDISADLNAMLSPNRYRVIFYAEEIKENTFWIADLTKWVYVPPPQFVISEVPTSINVRAGDSATVDIRVNSSQGFQPTVRLYTTNEFEGQNLTSPLLVDFKFNKLHMPSYGVVSTPLTIYVSRDALSYPYTLFIFANSTFPNGFIPAGTGLIPIETQSVKTQASVIIYVQNPLSPIDQISDFWNKIGSPITFIYGIIAGLAPWLFVKIKGKLWK